MKLLVARRSKLQYLGMYPQVQDVPGGVRVEIPLRDAPGSLNAIQVDVLDDVVAAFEIEEPAK